MDHLWIKEAADQMSGWAKSAANFVQEKIEQNNIAESLPAVKENTESSPSPPSGINPVTPVTPRQGFRDGTMLLFDAQKNWEKLAHKEIPKAVETVKKLLPQRSQMLDAVDNVTSFAEKAFMTLFELPALTLDGIIISSRNLLGLVLIFARG